MEIINREDAKAKGLKLYFTGKACKKGHIAMRYVSNCNCVECEKAYNEANKDSRKVKKKAYYEANKDSRKAYYEAYNEANKDSRKVKKKAYRKTEVGKAVARAANHNRRARIKESGGSHTGKDELIIFENQRGKCAICKCKLTKSTGKHVDHIIPIALGGTNDKYNIQITCKECNLKKGAKHPIEFMQELGLLL